MSNKSWYVTAFPYSEKLKYFNCSLFSWVLDIREKNSTWKLSSDRGSSSACFLTITFHSLSCSRFTFLHIDNNHIETPRGGCGAVGKVLSPVCCFPETSANYGGCAPSGNGPNMAIVAASFAVGDCHVTGGHSDGGRHRDLWSQLSHWRKSWQRIRVQGWRLLWSLTCAGSCSLARMDVCVLPRFGETMPISEFYPLATKIVSDILCISCMARLNKYK